MFFFNDHSALREAKEFQTLVQIIAYSISTFLIAFFLPQLLSLTFVFRAIVK